MTCLVCSDGTPRRRSLTAIIRLFTAMALCLSTAARADLNIPANGVVSLNGGVVDLACTDLVVAGTLLLGNGNVTNVRHVSIQGGGVVDGGSGIIELGGDWTNAGVFLAGSGSVRFRDLCAMTAASVGGSTSFFNASFVSTTGKSYAFAVGSTQTIVGLLEILGTAEKPIQFRSSALGQVANVNLLPNGAQSILHVGVTDVWATGKWLAPFQSNQGGGGNAYGWFGIPVDANEPIPTLATLAQVLLALALAGIAMCRLRRRTVQATTDYTSRATRDRGMR